MCDCFIDLWHFVSLVICDAVFTAWSKKSQKVFVQFLVWRSLCWSSASGFCYLRHLLRFLSRQGSLRQIKFAAIAACSSCPVGDTNFQYILFCVFSPSLSWSWPSFLHLLYINHFCLLSSVFFLLGSWVSNVIEKKNKPSRPVM